MFEKIRDCILIVCTVSTLFGVFILQADVIAVYRRIVELQHTVCVNQTYPDTRDGQVLKSFNEA